MKLGIVTYQIAKDWDVPTLIDMCRTTGLQGVELRTTHAHGVEIDLSPGERRDIRRRFEDAGIDIVGLGSVYEYHDADPETVRRNIDGTVEYARLAADLGCSGRQGASQRDCRRTKAFLKSGHSSRSGWP